MHLEQLLHGVFDIQLIGVAFDDELVLVRQLGLERALLRHADTLDDGKRVFHYLPIRAVIFSTAAFVTTILSNRNSSYTFNESACSTSTPGILRFDRIVVTK